jgi:hypothetical protein
MRVPHYERLFQKRVVHTNFDIYVFIFHCIWKLSALITLECSELWTHAQIIFQKHAWLITIFGSFLPPVICRRVHVLFTLFVFVMAVAQWRQMKQMSHFWNGKCNLLKANTIFFFFKICLNSPPLPHFIQTRTTAVFVWG